MARERTFHPTMRVAIWGMGLLGGSIGLGLKARGHAGRIVGLGRSLPRLSEALERGACDAAGDDPASALAEAELLVLCTPVDSMAPLLSAARPHLHERLLITDVGSTKGRLVHELEALLAGSPARFVGSHPMAGSEKTGVEFASPDLYRGATVAVTPTPGSDPAAVAAVIRFWEFLEARVLQLDARVHDRLVATTSHVPHLVSALLCQLLASRQSEGHPYRRMIGPGFLDTTRVAAGDPVMWRDILVHNREEIAAGLEALQGLLAPWLEQLQSGDAPALEAALAAAAEVRRGLER